MPTVTGTSCSAGGCESSKIWKNSHKNYILFFLCP
jgi:hypothetical protein